MKRILFRLLPRAATFCCECGEKITVETRPRWGGPRCAGCRAIVRHPAGPAVAVALAAAGMAGFWAGRSAGTAVRPPEYVPGLAAPVLAQPERPAAPPPQPAESCGGRTKKGTRCKRLVQGGGRCWQHGGARK